MSLNTYDQRYTRHIYYNDITYRQIVTQPNENSLPCNKICSNFFLNKKQLPQLYIYWLLNYAIIFLPAIKWRRLKHQVHVISIPPR